MKIITYLLVSLAGGLASIPAWASCIDLSSVTNWSNINTHKIIMYQESKAIAVLDIPSCDIYPSSDIKLDKSYLCSGDNIIVSGVACKIRDIERP